MSVSSPWQLNSPSLLLDFKEELRRLFNQLVITRTLDFVAGEEFQPINEVYVTLSSISYEDAVKMIGGPHQLGSRELVKAGSQVAAESKHSQELLDLHSLLRFPQGLQAKSALLFGSAGSGKTLTALKILSEFNSEDAISPFKRFEAIVYISGRERTRLSTKAVLELWQLWRMGYNEQQQEFIIDHYSRHSDKVLFLVDGWDEAGEDGLLQEDAVLKRVLGGELFRHSSVIITSRPAPTAYPLLEVCKRRYSLVGFNNIRLRELFNRRLVEPQASKLFDALSQSHNLHVKSAVQKTPLFAAMLVQLYKTTEILPMTITALYQSMLDSIRSRYVRWVGETQRCRKGQMMGLRNNSAQASFNEAAAKLGQLALSGWVSSRVTFTDQEVCACGKEAIQPRFGLLSEVKDITPSGSRILYHFNHLTWQEYFAAQSLAADPDFIKKLRVCISSIGVGKHTHLFWQFLAGLVDSHLLLDLVFGLAKSSGVKGFSPQETESRLFLMDCIAEFIRMRQISDEQFFTDRYVQVAGEMITTQAGRIVLNGCILDASRLSSIALVLRACPNIINLDIHKTQLEDCCPSLSAALYHLKTVTLADISGWEASMFCMNVFYSLNSTNAITDISCINVPITMECLPAIAQLINNNKSLTQIAFAGCELGVSSITFLSRSVHQSASLSKVVLENDHFTGAGRMLGEMWARCDHLENLQIVHCFLDNGDMAELLHALQNSCNLQVLHVEENLLTDDITASLLKYAVHRDRLAQQVQMSFGGELPALQLLVGNNELSREMFINMAALLPSSCGITIVNGYLKIQHGLISQLDHAAQIRDLLDSTDGHVFSRMPGMGDQGAIQISHFLTTDYAQLMRSLMLNGCSIGDSGAAAIAAALSCSTLQGLDMASNHITFLGFHQFMSTISGNCNLQYLNIGQNPIFMSSSSHLCSLTPSILRLSLSIQCLQIVSANDTKFSDEDDNFENSPLALMAIPSLSALDLSNNEMTDKSIPMISQWMGNMAYLSLSGNKISSDGGKVLINKAQALLENEQGQQRPPARLQRIWLGGNCIPESIFADCSCTAISSMSFCLRGIQPRIISSMFSSSASFSSLEQHLWATEQGAHSPFWSRMSDVVLSRSFNQCMEHFVRENFGESLDRWLTVAFQALAHRRDCSQPVVEAKGLINMFAHLSNWYAMNKADDAMILAINCCRLCVIDELILTRSLPSLQSRAEQSLGAIANFSASDNNLFILAMQYLSDVAERCRQRQLHHVADRLQEQMEFVAQSVLTAMQHCLW